MTVGCITSSHDWMFHRKTVYNGVAWLRSSKATMIGRSFQVATKILHSIGCVEYYGQRYRSFLVMWNALYRKFV